MKTNTPTSLRNAHRLSASTHRARALLMRLDLEAASPSPPSVPIAGYGLCQCGCGQPTKIATVNDARRGLRKGQPKKYVYGHNSRTGKRAR